MSRRLIALLVGSYGVLLAVVQITAQGVRTDEAKYLLNIPYPQPPLARFIMSATEAFPFQEFLWRVVFALILVETVFLVWVMTAGMRRPLRLFLSGGWLLSAGVALQIGTIMMAPLTGVQALIIVWYSLFTKEDRRTPASLFLFGLFWLASLFTAYQIILFLPLVFSVYSRSALPRFQKALYVLGPIGLVFLYALTNPFILGSFINAGSENLDIPLRLWIWFLFREWMTGGSLILSVLGMTGLLLVRRCSLLLSALLVSAFVFLSFRDYYDIYFTPIFLAGAILLFERYPNIRLPTASMLIGLVAVTCFTAFVLPPVTPLGPARRVLREIRARGGTGAILIAGPFGHQWQYESVFPIRKYNPEFLASAQAAICLHRCLRIEEKNTFVRMGGLPVEVWVRR